MAKIINIQRQKKMIMTEVKNEKKEIKLIWSNEICLGKLFVFSLRYYPIIKENKKKKKIEINENVNIIVMYAIDIIPSNKY